jgi:FlaA1/EpsC-like NDP-sugar epimerase
MYWRYSASSQHITVRAWSAFAGAGAPSGQQVSTASPRVLIVGAGGAGQVLAWRLRHRAPSGDHSYMVVGFVDDDPQKQGMYLEGCRVLGNRTDIPYLAERHKADLIALAIHNVSGADLREILTYCERTGARIKAIPDVMALMRAKAGTGLLRNIQVEDLIGRSAISDSGGVKLGLILPKTIMVTGAAGSIGSELCRQLCSYHASRLLLLDNNESGLHELVLDLSAKFPQITLTPVLADITSQDAVTAVFEGLRPQIVFHAAAYKHVPMSGVSQPKRCASTSAALAWSPKLPRHMRSSASS